MVSNGGHAGASKAVKAIKTGELDGGHRRSENWTSNAAYKAGCWRDCNRGAVDCNRGAGPLDEHIRLASVLGNLVAVFGQLSKANIWHNSVLLPFSKANH